MNERRVLKMSEKTEAIHDLLIEIIYTSKNIEEAKKRASELLQARAEAVHINLTRKNE